jgi:hypothetical protein
MVTNKARRNLISSRASSSKKANTRDSTRGGQLSPSSTSRGTGRIASAPSAESGETIRDAPTPVLPPFDLLRFFLSWRNLYESTKLMESILESGKGGEIHTQTDFLRTIAGPRATDCCLGKRCSTGWRAWPVIGAGSYCLDRRPHTEGRASCRSRRCQTDTRFTCEASREDGQWKARCPSPRQEKHLGGSDMQ